GIVAGDGWFGRLPAGPTDFRATVAPVPGVAAPPDRIFVAGGWCPGPGAGLAGRWRAVVRGTRLGAGARRLVPPPGRPRAGSALSDPGPGRAGGEWRERGPDPLHRW